MMFFKFWKRRGKKNPQVLATKQPKQKEASSQLIATDCGHPVKKSGTVTAFSKSKKYEPPFDKDGNTCFCHECLSKMAAQCPWCGGPIFIGEPVTLYQAKECFEVPATAVVYREDPLTLVGCNSCADSAMDIGGYWIPKGEVYVPDEADVTVTSDNDGNPKHVVANL